MKPTTAGAWDTPSTVSRLFHPENKPSFPASDASQLGPADNFSTLTTASHSTNVQQPAGRFDTFSGLSLLPNRIAPAAKPKNTDPNAPHAHLNSASKLELPSTIEPYLYWNNLLEQFVCPGHKCGRKFDTSDAFTAHLLTGAHVGGRRQCPSCLKTFGSTTALISHCESGNKKCMIRKSANYNQVMRELTGGLIGTDGHLHDGSVRYTANKVQDW